MRFPTPRLVAVQAVGIASAACSAAYYAMQAPAHTVEIAGHTFAPWIVAIALTAFALDATKPLMLAAATTPGAGIARRAVAGLIFAVLFAASMIAVDGMLMRLRSDWSAGRDRDVSAYAAARAEHDRLAAELARLARVRTTSEVRADMDRARVPSSIWSATRECTDADMLRGPVNAAACKPILDLRQEMAGAIRKGELERDLAASRTRLDAVSRPGSAVAARSADPQADVLAGLTGRNRDEIAYAMVLIIGFALELVACFGLYVAGAGSTTRNSAESGGTALAPAGSTGSAKVPALPPPVPHAAHRLPPASGTGETTVPPCPDPVVEWVRQFRARHGRNPQIPQVQAEFRIPKTTAWRRIRAA